MLQVLNELLWENILEFITFGLVSFMIILVILDLLFLVVFLGAAMFESGTESTDSNALCVSMILPIMGLFVPIILLFFVSNIVSNQGQLIIPIIAGAIISLAITILHFSFVSDGKNQLETKKENTAPFTNAQVGIAIIESIAGLLWSYLIIQTYPTSTDYIDAYTSILFVGFLICISPHIMWYAYHFMKRRRLRKNKEKQAHQRKRNDSTGHGCSNRFR